MKQLKTASRKQSSMTKRKRSEKSKYKHKSTGDHCTCAQYIAEILCTRKSEYENVGSLPYKFWNTKKWKWTFQKQVIEANKLIKKHGESAVVRAVESLPRVFSLRHPLVNPEIEKQKQLIKTQESKERKVVEIKENPTVRKKSFGKKSIFNKIKDIQNGKEEEGK